MQSTAPATSARSRQVQKRVFWFLAGSIVNYTLIKIPFEWLKAHTQLSPWSISALSLGSAAAIFFVWNYFVNFRTGYRKREALPRYLGAVGIMWLLSSFTLWLLKQHDAHYHAGFFGYALDLDIITTQAVLAGIKFPLYHKWAFPLPKEPAAMAEQPSSDVDPAAEPLHRPV